ncbi:hypothetical protein ASF09_19115 [Sphingomonas sp. Leaf242]|nr:hypothetical protein ASF09_19115 [Sphingomonas sp. Leaf242]
MQELRVYPHDAIVSAKHIAAQRSGQMQTFIQKIFGIGGCFGFAILLLGAGWQTYVLGLRLIQIQKATAVASATADRKLAASLS